MKPLNSLEAAKRGRPRQIISPDGTDGSLAVHQDARVCDGLFDRDESAHLDVGGGRNVYLHMARSSVEVNGERLDEGGGARIRDAGRRGFANGKGTELLVFDLRLNGLPVMQR